MANTLFVYAPNGVVEMVSRPTKAFSDYVRTHAHQYVPPSDWEHRPREHNARLDVYERRVVGFPSDKWQEKYDEVQDGIQPDGFWQVSLLYRDLPIDQARAKLKQKVADIAVPSIEKVAQGGDLMQMLGNMFEVVRDGVLFIAEVNWGSDRTAWPPEAKKWDAKFLAVESDAGQLILAGAIRDTQIAKDTEIDILDINGVRSYDETTGWPVRK